VECIEVSVIFSEDEYLKTIENEVFEAAVISVEGDREEQQDCAGAVFSEKEGLVIVCDGMGGQALGCEAGRLACGTFLSEYEKEAPGSDLHSFLLDAAAQADNAVADMKGEDGSPSRSGSTVTAVCVRESSLFWLSVGDSRIYIFRGGELVRATKDHSYKYLLDAQLSAGKISEEAYKAGMVQGEALVSFLGIGGLPFIESNDIPFRLRPEDRILLTSDGLYKLVSDEGIRTALKENPDIKDALNALEEKASKSAENINRDNMTVALIRIK